MKIERNSGYTRYDLETDPPVMVIVTNEGIMTFEQNGHYFTMIKGEFRELMEEVFRADNKRV